MQRSPVSQHRERRCGVIPNRVAVSLFVAMILGACSDSGPPKTVGDKDDAAHGGGIYAVEQVSCALFSLDDVAALLGVPVAQILDDSQEPYEGNWDCSFNGGGLDKLVSFNISLSPSSEKAALEMARFRSHLDTARDTEPFKEILAEGAYTEVEGVGDEALWTVLNGTLATRKGNLSLQINLPKERDVQMGIARKILSRL